LYSENAGALTLENFLQDGDVIDAKMKPIGGWVEDKEELEEGRKAEESSEEDEEGASRAKKRRKMRGGCPLRRLYCRAAGQRAVARSGLGQGGIAKDGASTGATGHATARERAQETLRQARAASKRREGDRARKRARKTTGLF
jgi:hypothetical protein